MDIATEAHVVLDFETSGLNYYEKDFRVTSCSLVWSTGETEFILGQGNVGARLSQLGNTPILVFNLSFELGVTRCIYPHLTLNYAIDVARLAQLFDGGGEAGPLAGFSLKKCTKRILHKDVAYEAEIHSWIRENVPGAKRGKEGAHISKAPLELLREYNIADSINTLELYKHITAAFEKEGYDWRFDHEYYLSTVSLVVDARIRGVAVKRDELAQNIEVMKNEISAMDAEFRERFSAEILQVRQRLLSKAQTKLKKKVLTELPEFNTGSKSHLEFLFVDLLKLNCGFQTKTGKPSFKSTHLPLYGEGGKMLAKRGKKLIILNQALALYQLSELSGRWHNSLKLIGTRTGRLAGGS